MRCTGPQREGDEGGAYSRLRPNLSEVVEELRQVGLEQPLKLQAQRHDPLQEAHVHEMYRRKHTNKAVAYKNQAAHRGRGGDGVQSEEVADVHFPENAVQLGRLVVQETQRCHCGTKTHTRTHAMLSLALAGFLLQV